MGIAISTTCNLLDICSLKPCERCSVCVSTSHHSIEYGSCLWWEEKTAVPGKLDGVGIKAVSPTDKWPTKIIRSRLGPFLICLFIFPGWVGFLPLGGFACFGLLFFSSIPVGLMGGIANFKRWKLTLLIQQIKHFVWYSERYCSRCSSGACVLRVSSGEFYLCGNGQWRWWCHSGV